MGNAASVQEPACIFLQDVPAQPAQTQAFMESYIRLPWRSERARELDALGGLNREPLARGHSMTAKLKYLEEHLQRQQREMAEVLAPTFTPKVEEPAPAGSLPWVMNTDVRAAARVHQVSQKQEAGSQDAPEPPRWGSPTPEELLQRRQQQILRAKMLSFARSVPHPSSELSPGREKTAIQETRYRYSGRLRASSRASMVIEVQPVAAWRIRVHAARRRMFLVILAVVRLQRGSSHPRRLRRVDSFSYCIPLALGTETPRFVEELTACQQASAALQEAQAAFIYTSEFELPAHSQARLLHRTATLPVRPVSSTTGMPLHASTHESFGGLCSPRASLLGEAPFAVSSHTSALILGCLPGDARPQSRGPPTFDQRLPSTSGSSLGSAYVMSLGGSSHCSSMLTSVANSSHGGSSAACGASAGGSSSHESRVSSSAGAPGGDESLLETHEDGATLPFTADQDLHGIMSSGCDALDITPPHSTLSVDNGPAAGVLSMAFQGPLESLDLGNRSSLVPDMTPTPGRVLRPSVSVPARSTRFNSVASKLVPPLPPKAAMPPKAPSSAVNSARRQPVLPPLTTTDVPAAQASRPSLVSPARSSMPRARSSLDTGRPGSAHRQSLEARMELLHVAEVQSAAVARGIGMMAMYLNRVNGAWAESCNWRSGVAPLQPMSELEAFATSEHFPVYKADLIRLLRQGQVVWHINTEDVLSLPSSHGVVQHVPLWCADPWHLLAAARPGSLPLGTRLEGISLGGRSLAQLTSAVEGLAGPEAVRNLSVVLQVPSKWKSVVTQDLMVHRMYGLSPHRVYIVETPDWPGYVWNSTTKTWVRSSEAEQPAPGKGNLSHPDAAASKSRRSSRSGGIPSTAATPRRQTLTQLGKSKPPTKLTHEAEAHAHEALQSLKEPEWTSVMGPSSTGSLQDMDKRGSCWPCLDQGNTPPVRSLGAGYGIMQCAWPGEAVQLLPVPIPDKPDADHPGLGSVHPSSVNSLTSPKPTDPLAAAAAREESRVQLKEKRLEASLWEALQAHQVEWMISLRSRDMVLLGRDGGPVDVATLPYILYMRDKARITMSVLGVHASQVQARQADSVLLMHTPAPAKPIPRANSNIIDRQKWLLPGRVGDKTVELRYCELGGGSQMAELQNGWRAASAGTQDPATLLAVGLQRYVFHLPSLITAVSQANAFRPKLLLSGMSVHVSHEISDLTSHPSMCCLALAAPVRGCGPTSTINSLAAAADEEGGEVTQVAHLPLLTRVGDLDELVPLLCKQDSHKWVRKWASLAGGRVVIGTGSSSTASNNPKPSGTPASSGSLLHQPVDRSLAPVQVLAGYEEELLEPNGNEAAAGAKPGLKGWSGEVLADHPAADPTLSPLAHALASAAELRRAKRAALGQHLVVFVVPNNVAQLAVNLAVCMARPCLDRVHLVTVVSRAEHESQALQHLQSYESKLQGAGVSCSTLVVVKSSGKGLLDCMQEAVHACRGGMVIMGSKALTSGDLGMSGVKAGGQGNNLQPQVIGSVTLSAIKRLDVPVAVVTTNTRNLAGACVPRSCMNAVALVEPQSRPMLHYLSARCLDPLRGDRLLLVQQVPVAHITLQQAAQQRRLMESFADTASEHHMPPSDKLVLTGDSANRSQLLDLLQSESIQLVGLQVSRASGRVLPPHVLNLLGSSHAAVLVYKET